ncbi:methyltransferase domain-containing protein [Nocardia seriolae]|uniref:methyltransferase domain-containing protein n=1 Tax=Nocardia seriolae TaxID=37332 RepID=UPI0031FE83B5
MSRRTEPVDRLTGASVDTETPPLGPAEPPPVDRLLACADLLACPQCGHLLAAPVADPAVGAPSARTLRCPHGHSFDLAKQGYVSLLTGASSKMTGDTPAMLDARAAFQSAGHFAPIAAALAAAVATHLPPADIATPIFGAESLPAATSTGSASRDDPAPAISAARRQGFRPGITTPGGSVAAASAARLATTLLGPGPGPVAGAAVLEIGAGTGYYLAAVLDAVDGARGIALDVSKAAARRAARAHGRAGAVLADAWRGLPIRDGVLDAVICVFAPRNADEVARVLREDGRFVVVTPTSRHLGELIGPLGMVSVDAAKQDRLADSLGERFELVGRESVEYTMALSHRDVANVVAMGPSAFHAAEQRAEGIAALPDPMAVTAAVSVATYRVR